MANKKALALDRVISITCQKILDRSYAEISVAEVAVEARCSTATIYEVYGTKENLYIDALAQLLFHWTPPVPRESEGCALEAILTYARARIEYFANPKTRKIFRALRECGGKGSVVAREQMEARASFGSLVLLVEQAFDEKTLRRTSAESVAYLIAAGATFEAFMGSEFFGEDLPVDVAMIVSRVFLPLVEGTGRAILARFAEAIPVRPISRRLPLASDQISDHAEIECLSMMRRTLMGLGVAAPHRQIS